MHPGTVVYNTDRFGGWSSLEPMWHQVQEIGKDLMNISKAHPDGIHVLGKKCVHFKNFDLILKFSGYSQGGLVARVILETFPEHNVDNFISLSSPQAGQYGSKYTFFSNAHYCNKRLVFFIF